MRASFQTNLTFVAVPDQEHCRLLSSLSVVVLEHVRVGLKEESNVCVPDALAHDLGIDSSLEGRGRV